MNEVVVVKFGASSLSPDDLMRWVRAFEGSTRPLVLVPGGGPFATTVKQYQTLLGYDDDTAHHMAVLAMEQFGRAIVSLSTRLVACATETAIESAIKGGKVPVWMPAKLVLRADEIGHDWFTTSDSLAAWLAGRFPGAPLCLIKPLDMPEGADLEAISAAGFVDPSFVRLLHPATRVHLVGPADLALAGKRLAAGVVPGREVRRSLRETTFEEAAQ